MNLIKANRDENVLIKEAAKYCIHVRLSKTNYNPTNPQIHSTNDKIVVFTPEEYEKEESHAKSRQAYNWVTVAGWDKAYIVHDGRLVAKEEKPEETKEEVIIANEVKQIVKEAVKKERRRANVRASLNKS